MQRVPARGGGQGRGLRPSRPEEVRGRSRGRAEVHSSPGRDQGKGVGELTPPKGQEIGARHLHSPARRLLPPLRSRASAQEAEVGGCVKDEGWSVAERTSAHARGGRGLEERAGRGGAKQSLEALS